MFRIFLVLFFAFLFSTNISAEIPKHSIPSWVNETSVLSTDYDKSAGGYHYLLIDKQDNIPSETYFRHYTYKILNNEGVQSMSDLNIGYDPSYQKLRWHKIDVIRDGKKINKLSDSDAQLLQRETSLERSLYDGSLSSVVNLSDIRVGDIVDYAYSIEGFNPINDGQFSSTYYLNFTIAVDKIYTRIVTDSDHAITYKLFENAPEPSVQDYNGMNEYSWDLPARELILYDNNVPIWFDPQMRASVTTYSDWLEVIEWADELYKYSDSEVERVKKKISEVVSEEDRILNYIRIVQDDIRYLGFESGISAYKPNSPSKVFNQKYGDCKDKSLLLVALLRSEGIESYPLLVNTQIKNELDRGLPAGNLFDHCVVQFNYQGKDYFVDPTISNQGGDLDNINFPNYGKGLLINKSQNGLIDIPETAKSKISIKELIEVDSVGGNANYTVRTEYSGRRADGIRSYFNTNTKESIQRDYLNYYSGMYPKIEIDKEIKFLDYDRNTGNKVIVEEYYKLKDSWEMATDSSYIYFEVYPIVLESELSFAKSASRKMPYYLGSPYIFDQETVVNMPETWSVTPETAKHSGPGFNYTSTIDGSGSIVEVNYHYELTKGHISADSVEVFLSTIADVKNDLSHVLTYSFSMTEFELSWISVLIAISAVVLGIFFAIKIYKGYDPLAWEHAQDKSIGSWLILPAIGLSLTPIILLTQVFSEDFFNHNNWIAYLNSGYGNVVAILLLYGVEILYNFIYLVFSILILVLFYQRRTSLPRIVSIFYAVSFAFPVIDMFLVDILLPGHMTHAENQETIQEIFRAFVAAAIWIPYFNISQRSKNTFCKQYAVN